MTTLYSIKHVQLCRVFINDSHINIQNMFQLKLNKYSMRNTNTFILSMIYNNINKFHTVYYGPVSWNSLLVSIRGSKSIDIFLKRLQFEFIFI